ncbi:MAG: methyltransferase [Pseudomonadales bacterium]|nr:methyltransferase [Pseudomonadales bacterium]
MKKLENTPSKDLDSRFKKYCESYSSNINTVSVQGIDFLVYPNVYRAESASTTSTILRTMDDFEGLRVLDMGCGTGILGIIAALKGASYVMMADINDAAIENTKANIEKHQLSHRTKAVTSDLFSNITEKSFDIILFNMPFLYAKENPSEASLTPPEHKAKVMPPPESFVDVGYKTIRRFMTEA